MSNFSEFEAVVSETMCHKASAGQVWMTRGNIWCEIKMNECELCENKCLPMLSC